MSSSLLPLKFCREGERRDLCNAAMKYGLANEEIARKQYEREYSTEVKICGLFVDKDKPFLCASPDGLVGDDGLRN
ncbi:hypothetical protein TNCV_1009011 [Trichonephila clavipes]|nr:hypothetical protein TNCV_1009011 [Trichonephila clavipes]